MQDCDEPARETQVPREPDVSLSAAILRISASLDLGTVLREVVDSARLLTRARYAIIATIDEAGQPQEFVASGFTPKEQRLVVEWPPALRFFNHLRDLPGPLRLTDLPAYIRSLGHAPDLALSKTFQAMPMRHRGVHVGAFFLGEKKGGLAFTADDEQTLVLFASQAAAAIGNARTHRDEQRARADLEALVETSPVGVVVFDAGTGNPVSLNREARRIAEGLGTPGQPPEQLLEVLICRFSDGREVALADLPMRQIISGAATVRAEEVVLSVPDGRSITLLVNATPNRSADGAAESMVVTLQDLAPLEELERLRVEFLGMVSHELRAPLAAIKGSARRIGTFAGKEPVPGPLDLPPGAQNREQLRRQHHVAVLLSLALRDAQHHPFAVDGGHGQRNGLGDAQAGGVAGGQDGAMLRGLDRIEKLDHFLRAEHDRQRLRLLRRGDHVVEGPPLLKRDPIEEAQRRHGDEQRARCESAFGGQVDLIGADLLGTEALRGPVEVAGEPRDGLDVRALGERRQPSHLHVFEHALTKGCHRTLLCEGPGGFQALAEQRRRGSRAAAAVGESDRTGQ